MVLRTDYLETSGVVVQNDRQYERGAKKPAYFWLQVIILAMIAWLARSFKGSRKAVGWTAAVFVVIAYPNERYALESGSGRTTRTGCWAYGSWACRSRSGSCTRVVLSALA
jgi:hypothetical protein